MTPSTSSTKQTKAASESRAGEEKKAERGAQLSAKRQKKRRSGAGGKKPQSSEQSVSGEPALLPWLPPPPLGIASIPRRCAELRPPPSIDDPDHPAYDEFFSQNGIAACLPACARCWQRLVVSSHCCHLQRRVALLLLLLLRLPVQRVRSAARSAARSARPPSRRPRRLEAEAVAGMRRTTASTRRRLPRSEP